VDGFSDHHTRHQWVTILTYNYGGERVEWPSHGGQPAAIKRLFKLSSEQQILDFSANLNPLGPPKWLKEALGNISESFSQYPDPTYTQVNEAIAHFEGLERDQVLVSNGGAEAIFLVAKHFEGKRALIVQPTFVEYEKACLHYHVETEDVYLDIQQGFTFPLEHVLAKMNEVQAVFICRPNNPTGTVVEEEVIRILLDEGLKTGTTIIIDEAFVDFLPENIFGLTEWVNHYPNLILLRSLTKMYTIPGLRIGYIMAGREVIQALRSYQIPWSVNAIVAALTPKLLNDLDFVKQTKEWLVSQLGYVSYELDRLGFYVSPSQVNFYLLQDPKDRSQTHQLFLFLLEEGILARHTHNFKGLNGDFLRLAVRSQEENRQLIRALQIWRETR
jgi:threonine-phosphate decarboxylase